MRSSIPKKANLRDVISVNQRTYIVDYFHTDTFEVFQKNTALQITENTGVNTSPEEVEIFIKGQKIRPINNAETMGMIIVRYGDDETRGDDWGLQVKRPESKSTVKTNSASNRSSSVAPKIEKTVFTEVTSFFQSLFSPSASTPPTQPASKPASKPASNLQTVRAASPDSKKIYLQDFGKATYAVEYSDTDTFEEFKQKAVKKIAEKGTQISSSEELKIVFSGRQIQSENDTETMKNIINRYNAAEGDWILQIKKLEIKKSPRMD